MPLIAADGRTVSQGYVAVLAALATGLVTACLILAWQQWFYADDFYFLWRATQPHDWVNDFAPLSARPWWSYRPLTIDVYFRACRWLFGGDPFGYLAVSLAFHFATGGVVYRLSRQFGLPQPIGLATALMSVSCYPSLNQVLWVSVSQYTIALFFSTLSVSLHLDYLRNGTRVCLPAALGAYVLTLLANEAGVTVAGVVMLAAWRQAGFPMSWCGLGRAVRPTLPALVVLGVYAIFRTRVLGPAAVPAVYTWELDGRVFHRFAAALLFVFGSDQTAALLALLATAVVAVLGMRRTNWRSPGGAAVVAAGWLVLNALPFVGLPMVHPRFAMPLVAPACLLVGACLRPWGQAGVVVRRWPLELLLVLFCLVLLPWSTLWYHPEVVRGAWTRGFAAWVDQRTAHLSPGATVVVRYGGPGLASAADAEEFRSRVFGGALFGAVFPSRQLALAMVDSRQPSMSPALPQAAVLDLGPGLALLESDERATTGDTPVRDLTPRASRADSGRVRP